MMVYLQLPDYAHEIHFSALSKVREAQGVNSEGNLISFFFCKHCNGWIEGFPEERRLNTMNSFRLSGRRGISFVCIHCQKEISFWGAVS